MSEWRDDQQREGEVVLLIDSWGPVQRWFNATAGQWRFLALLSPTWVPCLDGARAVQEIVLVPPRRGLVVGLVWLPMLAADDLAAAQQHASALPDRRVAHFYDPHRAVGRAIAASLSWTGEIAWDTYLFYPPSSEWASAPPPPTTWVCQLGDHAADRAHFRWGLGLWEYLAQAVRQIADPI